MPLFVYNDAKKYKYYNPSNLWKPSFSRCSKNTITRSKGKYLKLLAESWLYSRAVTMVTVDIRAFPGKAHFYRVDGKDRLLMGKIGWLYWKSRMNKWINQCDRLSIVMKDYYSQYFSSVLYHVTHYWKNIWKVYRFYSQEKEA